MYNDVFGVTYFSTVDTQKSLPNFAINQTKNRKKAVNSLSYIRKELSSTGN